MSAVVPALDALALAYVRRHPATAAQVLQDVDPDAAVGVLVAAPAQATAAVLGALGADSAVRLLRRMPPEATRRALVETDPAAATALLRRMGDEAAQRELLRTLPATRRRELETFLTYPEDSAGSLMDPAVPTFRNDARAGDVAEALRESHRVDEIVLVVTPDGELQGTLPTVAVLLAPAGERLSALRIQAAPSIDVFASRDDVAERLAHLPFQAMPVVDVAGRPVGVLSQRALAQVAGEDVAGDMQAMVGASRDERALSPASFAVRKRLPWLVINLATAFLAAGVVGAFESTIARFTALAVLLPVVAGQSGNTGAQALAVTMRGLALHEIGLGHWVAVLLKEAIVGFVNGVAVAVPTMIGVFVWSGSPGLTSVMGIAMVLSMTIAGAAGAAVPVVLQATGQDPAQSSSIVLTTVTDISGFLSFLGLAALFARWL